MDVKIDFDKPRSALVRNRFKARATVAKSLSVAILLLGVCVGFTMFPNTVAACAFHNYKPPKTIIDQVLGGKVVVLARPDPENRYRYKIVRYFKGVSTTTKIPFLVDSVTRRRLSDNPEHGVLFAFDGDWSKVSYMDKDHLLVLEEVTENLANWQSEEFHPDRFLFFAGYQDHPNSRLRRLALQEFDRVPYKMLRTITVRFSEDALLKSLTSPVDFQYRPISYLLLGMTGTPSARLRLLAQIEFMRDLEYAPALGAVATALIETERGHGVDMLKNSYLLDPGQSSSNLNSVVEAMAIQSNVGSKDLKVAINDALKEFVVQRPNMAGMVAGRLAARQDWSLAAILEEILETRRDLNAASRLTVAIYVAQSKTR